MGTRWNISFPGVTAPTSELLEPSASLGASQPTLRTATTAFVYDCMLHATQGNLNVDVQYSTLSCVHCSYPAQHPWIRLRAKNAAWCATIGNRCGDIEGSLAMLSGGTSGAVVTPPRTTLAPKAPSNKVWKEATSVKPGSSSPRMTQGILLEAIMKVG